jgi:hypothetical protein
MTVGRDGVLKREVVVWGALAEPPMVIAAGMGPIDAAPTGREKTDLTLRPTD